MCTKIINNVVLSKQEFKDFYLKNNYNENMFKSDGSLDLNYNSNKNTGLIAQIFEEHWDNLSPKMKESIIKIKPNALKEIKGVEKVEADYKTGIVKILANENIERKAMEDTIEDIGFEVVKEN